jgi:sugar lactone lactonase YvrE
MRNVTSLTFAGPAFTTAFVTTAAQGSDEDDETADALFRLEPGVEGIAEFRSKMSV